MSSFKSQPDVRVRNCSWSFFPSFLMCNIVGHFTQKPLFQDKLQNNLPRSFTIMCIGMRREERRMDLLGFQALIRIASSPGRTKRKQQRRWLFRSSDSIQPQLPVLKPASLFRICFLQTSQHKRCSLGFQKPELWNSAALEKQQKNFLPLLSPHQRNA